MKTNLSLDQAIAVTTEFVRQLQERYIVLKASLEKAISAIPCDCEMLAAMGNKPPCHGCRVKKEIRDDNENI